MRKIMIRVGAILALIAITAVTECSAQPDGFKVRPGSCATALEMLWKEATPSMLVPNSGAPRVTLDIGGEFVPETRVILVRREEGVRADVLQVSGGPLCKQLEVLEERKRFDSLTAAVRTIEVKHRIEQEGAALKALYNQLESLQVKLTPADTIFLPGRGYKIAIEGLAGSVEVEYTVPEDLADRVAFAGSTDLPNQSLRTWVDLLVKELDITFDQTEVPPGGSPTSEPRPRRRP